MTSETKQDVFNAVVGELNGLMATKDCGGYYHRYAKAVPDDLPVIPGAVGELIKAQKEHYLKLSNVLGPVNSLGIMRQQSSNPVLNWVSAHEDEFARAWVLEAWKIKETGEVVKL